MNFILGKYVIHYTKETIRALRIIFIATAIIIGIIAIKYKPAYAVTVSGENVGYISEKERLEKKINNFINNTEGCIAFIEATIKPEYNYVFVNRNTETIDDKLLAQIKDTAITTYRTYAISVDGAEKAQVDSQASAETIVNQVKNGVKEEVKLDLAITEVYGTELNIATNENALATLTTIKDEKVAAYEKAKAEEAARKAAEEAAKKAAEAAKRAASKSVNTSADVSYNFATIQVALANPISGTITSRFGARSSRRSSVHTGLDIAAPKGTPIAAAAAGTVVYAASKGAYGNFIVINHGNGVQTYYAHCSAINVSVGQTVSQGQNIGAVGSTGNSTGPHLHLEVRVNGVAQNPQNYVYR